MESISLDVILCSLIVLIAILLLAVYHYSRTLAKIKEEAQRDVQKVIQAEENKQNLEKALLHGQKLQAIGTLAGGIAHDFNNILYAIKGYVEIARDDLPPDTLPYQNLTKSLEAATRGQDLVSHILTFSRTQKIQYQPIELCAAIQHVLVLLKPSIPTEINLRYESTLKEVLMTGNETQLYQIITNIVNNAVDAITGEGSITIKLSALSADDELRHQLTATGEQHFCRIDITDTGHGMNEATMARMFEPFYTTKELGKGTGLGLSTVHAIVKEYRGIMAVHSQPEKGTTFTLILPVLTTGEPAQGERYGKNFTRRR